MILEHLAKRNDEWRKMARRFSLEPDDALQDAYIKLYYRFKNEPETLIDMHPNQLSMYVYLTLRSCAYTNIRAESSYADLPEDIEDEPPYDPTQDNETEIRIQQATEEVNSWHWYDQKLFNLHTMQGMSMREISRETMISLSSIFHTIKTCKERLRDKVK
jgi:RNA polymerase sigma factor (sigma-70 family)